MGLDNTLLTNLKNLNFQEPTAVQRLALPIILHKRKDIIAAAETGSGKTLAFGLPLVQMISWIPQARRKSESLSALILCPTRELALQVQAHIDAVAANTTVTTCCIVGGISEDKQVRLLNRRPDIVVGTPGRLWIHISQGHAHLSQLHKLKFLVLDEADRMLDRGHYAELNQIVLQITRTRVEEQVEDDEVTAQGGDYEADGSSARGSTAAGGGGQQRKSSGKSGGKSSKRSGGKGGVFKRQTLLFSATMMLDGDGRKNAKISKTGGGKKGGKKGGKRGRGGGGASTATILQDLMERVGCRGEPAIVDVTKARKIKADREAAAAEAEAKGTTSSKTTSSSSSSSSSSSKQATQFSLPEKLQLARIDCTQEDKDLYLYYFCKKHPGRTIIFANSIAVVRKISLLLSLMQINVYPLHAQMQQRQRLKNVDRFKSQKHIVLVASDVAARGLDVPNVDYVVHFNVARTPGKNIHLFLFILSFIS